MKSKILIAISLLLFGCSSSSSSSIINSSEISSLNDTSSNNVVNTYSSDSSFNELDSNLNTNSFKESSSDVKSSSFNSSSSNLTSSSFKEEKLDEHDFPLPNYEVNFSSEETIFDFQDTFPQEFKYIYGYKVLNNPSFYASGGWKISYPNSKATLGFQTPFFNSDLKLEIRFYLGDINNSNNKVDKDSPFLTIYGFNKEGKLIRTVEIANQTNFYNYQNNVNPMNFYINGENISYLEVRFTSPPYKSSQCYNFAIKKIGFKIFPYPLNERS